MTAKCFGELSIPDPRLTIETFSDIFVSCSDKYITPAKEKRIMKQESSGNIKSLRWYHAAIIVLSALGALAVLFVDNWSEMIWLLPIAVATCFDGKFEKSDELVKQNISRANTITMWILFAVLCVFAMHARFHAISATHILVVMFSAFALRSILFIIFDCSFIGKEQSDG